jgi:transposase
VEASPCYNSIFNILGDEEITPILMHLIRESAKPLKSVECDFAVDSSVFTTSRFVRWFDQKWGKVREWHHWVKVQLICGVKTNIVTGVEMPEGDGADSPFLPALVRATERNFKIASVCADKGYSTVENHEVIDSAGAVPFIPFKKTATGGSGGLWEKCFHYFNFRRDDFLKFYHKRSNVESTFSMMKRKFGDALRSKTDVAMKNEILCKILCHNIVVLIHEMFELGIEPSFWAESTPAQEIGA